MVGVDRHGYEGNAGGAAPDVKASAAVGDAAGTAAGNAGGAH